MKKQAIAAAVAFGLCAGAAQAQNAQDFGVGVILAEPTGVSAKYWMDGVQAIDLAAAWSFSGHDSFQFHADYLIHRFDLFRVDERYGRLPLYFGLGGRLKLGDDDNGRRPRGNNDDDDILGIRVPVGVTYIFQKAPFDVFGEIVPVLDVVPDTEVDLNVAIGGRFYFGRREQLVRR